MTFTWPIEQPDTIPFRIRDLGIQIIENPYLKPGTALAGPRIITLGPPSSTQTDEVKVIIMHPLDRIAIQYPNPLERLDAAMGWILADAHRKLDQLDRKIATMTVITLVDHANTDDDHKPYKFAGTTQKIIGYLDGPVRRDVAFETELLDTAIEHLLQGRLVPAASYLEVFSITLIVDGTRLERTCRECGCTTHDCSNCIEATGAPCAWVPGQPDLCTACDTINHGSDA